MTGWVEFAGALLGPGRGARPVNDVIDREGHRGTFGPDAMGQDTIIIRDDADVPLLVDPRRAGLRSRWRWGRTGRDLPKRVARGRRGHLEARTRLLDERFPADGRYPACGHRVDVDELTLGLKGTSLKRVAVLNSSDFIHQMAADAWRPRRTLPTMCFFDAADEAERWLKEVERS